MDISPDTLVTIKSGVFWKGYDIGGKQALVIDSESYILAVVEGIDGYVKLFRSEIAKGLTEEEYFNDLSDIFSTLNW